MMKSASLYFREGSSDKVYHATVEEKGGGHVVNFEYGRRGGHMTTGSKTSSPVSLAEAVKVWEKLVNSKLAKGYRHITDASQGTIPQAELPETPTEIQCCLLNPVDEDECERLLDDPQWVAQPKFDGVRFMLGRKNGNVYALNRKGKQISVPNEIAEEAKFLGDDYLLDGELVSGSLYVFDILEAKGVCHRGLTIEERSLRLGEVLDDLADDSPLCGIPLTQGKNKRKLYERLRKEGGEGVVFKRLGAKYSVGRPASGGNFLKFKFYASCSCRVIKVNQKRSVSIVMGCGTEVGNVTIPANHEVPGKGDVVEVRYLYAYRGGSLYQPTYLGVRDDVDPDHADTLKFKNEDEE